MLKFEAVFGVVAGYGHDNNGTEADPDAVVARAWREAMEAEFASSGILVGAVVSAGRVVYPADFGCPENGEIVATVRGDANPKFIGGEGQPSLTEFHDAVIRVADATRAALQQERLQLSFSDNSGFVYYEPEETGGTQRWYGD
jgi:hypothetical protein